MIPSPFQGYDYTGPPGIGLSEAAVHRVGLHPIKTAGLGSTTTSTASHGDATNNTLEGRSPSCHLRAGNSKCRRKKNHLVTK